MSTDARGAEHGHELRRRADESREVAAEHRARAHELRAGAAEAAPVDGVGSEAYRHAGIDEVRAQVAELRAAGLEERAAASDAIARADMGPAGEREDLLSQAAESDRRADALEHEAGELQGRLESA